MNNFCSLTGNKKIDSVVFRGVGVTSITPKEYIHLCYTHGIKSRNISEVDKSKIRKIYDLIGVVKLPTPYLKFGRFDQDGYHRAYAYMLKFGEDTEMPVVVVNDSLLGE